MLEDRPGAAYSRPISFSGGVANLPDQASSRVELLARADAAMYRSKRNGRTLVTVFDSAVDRPVLEGAARARLSDQLARVIAERQLHPVYQPIVDVATGGCVAYEGLIRPVRGSGFASPGELFGAAEVTGRVTELDRACLEAVLAGAAEIPDAVSLSLNISPRTFEAPEFSAAAFLKIIDRHGLEPGRVILELTERESIEDVDRLRGALEACRAAGIRIAADDVGAGNAGIRLLSQIQFDVMKIDLSLVQAGAGREPVASVLRSLVDLGSRWRAMVIAEGVETPDQLRMIRTLGIQAVQGYLLARPGPVRTDLRFDFAALDAQATDWAARRPTWEQIGGAVRATPAS
jgi:EAL domain-containing protein (putative c-di-GMP-specific phosphodiesterase class I)